MHHVYFLQGSVNQLVDEKIEDFSQAKPNTLPLAIFFDCLLIRKLQVSSLLIA